MAVKYLLLDARVRVPYSASLVAARRDDLVALRIKLDLRYLILMAFEKRRASSSEHVVYPC